MKFILPCLAACALFSSFTTAAVNSFAQGFHASLTQKATVGCALATNLTLTFFLDEGSDFIGAIYLVNQTDPTDNTEATFSLTTGDITGNGTAVDPRTFSVVALTNGSHILDIAPNSAGLKAEIIGGEVLSVHVMVKSNSTLSAAPFLEKVIFPDDVLYTAYCNISALSDILVSTEQINTTGVIEEAPVKLTETVDMVIIDATVPTQTVAVGSQISLRLRHRNNATSYATGLYAHTCSVCDAVDCKGALAIEFIDPKGCAVSDYISQFNVKTDYLETTQFLAFILRDVNFMFYRCYVDFCYTPSDPNCVDFCAANAGKPRNKREAEERQEDPIAVSTFLRVTVGENDEIVIEDLGSVDNPNIYKKQAAVPEPQQAPQNMVLLGTVVSLAVLLLVGLAVAVIVFYRLSSRTKSHS